MSRNTLLAIICGFALSACATTFALQELRSVEPVDSPFHKELAGLYLEFSENEADQYDWRSSQYFAEKGLMVAYGNNVVPERPQDWNIPEPYMHDVLLGRDALEEKLKPEIYAEHPEKLAQAHFYYDCWLEQLEENWQSTDIEICRERFVTLLEELEPTVQTAREGYNDFESVGGPEIAPVITANSYLLFFPWDESVIDVGQARLELSVLLDDLQENPDIDVVINGHADRSGTDQYNLDLSQQRAEFVRNTLIKAGVPEQRIVYFAFGETDPRIPTEDGVREPANRRVEIFIE